MNRRHMAKLLVVTLGNHFITLNSLETGDELGLVFVSSVTGSYRFVNPSMTAIDVLGESFSILVQL